MTRKSAEKMTTERMYEVLRAPVITEKSTMGSEEDKVTFQVSLDATKPEIRKAVETLFDVRVVNVNTLVQAGKRKRFRGNQGKRPDYKKAVVRLAEGQHIDIMAGV